MSNRSTAAVLPPPDAPVDMAAPPPSPGTAMRSGVAGSGQRSPTGSDSAVGHGIRERRRAQGRTQQEVARLVGVTGAQLHRYETGATRIAASRLIAIADALGVTAHALISAGSAPRPPAAATSGDDIVELIQLFSSIDDPKHRSALIAVARMIAEPPPREKPPAPVD